MVQASTASRICSPARPPVAALGKLTMAAALGFPLLVSSDLIRHGLTMPGLLFTGVALVLAGIVSGLIATGWRWTPLLGAVLYVLILLTSASIVITALSHPGDTYLFAFNVIAVALTVVGVTAGIGATAQNLPSCCVRSPRSALARCWAVWSGGNCPRRDPGRRARRCEYGYWQWY